MTRCCDCRHFVAQKRLPVRPWDEQAHYTWHGVCEIGPTAREEYDAACSRYEPPKGQKGR